MTNMCHYILNMIVLFLMIDFIKTINKCFAIYKILPIFVTDNQQEKYSSSSHQFIQNCECWHVCSSLRKRQ